MKLHENCPTARVASSARRTLLDWARKRMVSTGDTPRRVSSIIWHGDALVRTLGLHVATIDLQPAKISLQSEKRTIKFFEIRPASKFLT